MLKKWVCLATLIFCCIFSCQGKGICFSLHYFPVACLTKTTLLLIMTRGSYLLLPLELQQQKAFKTMVSVMTIKLKRLEFKNSNCGECQVRYSEEDISVEYGSPAAWAKLLTRWSLWVSSSSENSWFWSWIALRCCKEVESLSYSKSVWYLLAYCKVRLILFSISYCFNLNIGRGDVRVKVSGDCEQHMDHFSW